MDRLGDELQTCANDPRGGNGGNTVRRNPNSIVLKIINALANLYKISLVENLNTKEFQDQIISESQRFLQMLLKALPVLEAL